jgi:Ser/Thr protein kinase RdoA (MazF antagonist)
MVRFEELSDEQRITLFETLGRAALRRYGIETADLSHRTYSENVIFEVRPADGGRYALRVCRPNTDPTDLEREITWLHALVRDTELRIPAPVMTAGGDPFTQAQIGGIPEPRYCALFTWVSGDYARGDELTPQRLDKAGEFLARLHAHAETYRLPERLALPRQNADSLSSLDISDPLAAYFPDRHDINAFEDALSTAASVMRELGEGSDVAGIIHGDFHQRNYIFDGEEIGAIDFETMWWGYYLYDLATTLSYLVPDFLRDRDPQPLRQAVVRSYERHRGLPADAPRYLRVFEAYRLWIMADWVAGSPRMLEHDWARGRLDRTPQQIRALLDAF